MKFIILIALPLIAFSHGEDKLGPHQGFIKMPGAFHTEVVLEGPRSLKVFLLDMNWKNPSVKDSEVQILEPVGATCKIEDDYFRCALPEGFDGTKKGKLKLATTREKQKGNSAIYDLPLALKKPMSLQK